MSTEIPEKFGFFWLKYDLMPNWFIFIKKYLMLYDFNPAIFINEKFFSPFFAGLDQKD